MDGYWMAANLYCPILRNDSALPLLQGPDTLAGTLAPGNFEFLLCSGSPAFQPMI